MATIEIKQVDQRFKSGTWKMPDYESDGAAGLDLAAALEKPLAISPGQTKLIPTGISISINDTGIMAMIAPRSGMGHKHGIVLGNLVGIIDSDYQGQLFVSAWNRNAPDLGVQLIGEQVFKEPYIVEPGDRICQMIFVPVIRPVFKIVEEFSEVTTRGEGGFNSTGVKQSARA